MRNVVLPLFWPSAILVIFASFVVGGAPTGAILLNAALLPVVTFVSLLLHECGHAAAAWAVGLDVPRMEIGLGRRLWRRRIGKTTVVVNVAPVLGLTFIASGDRPVRRSQLWITILAGPLTTALLVVIAFGDWRTTLDFGAHLRATTRGVDVLVLVGLANYLLLLGNLFPMRFRGTYETDGLQLLKAPFQKQTYLDEISVASAILEAEDLRLERRLDDAQRILDAALKRVPHSLMVQNSVAVMQLEREHYAEARASFLKMLDGELPNELSRQILRNNIAWANYCLQQPELKAQADEFSASAFKLMSGAPAAMGSRGMILIWLDRHSEGVKLVETAYSLASAPQLRAEFACHLAIAFAAKDQLDDARLWLDKALTADRGCPKLEKARSAIDDSAKRAGDAVRVAAS